MMFHKITDQNELNARMEYLRSFGAECLDKVKGIEKKLHKIQWDTDKYSLDTLVPKIKALLQSYHIIAHEIYDTCESVQLEDFGHSILKMFLQIFASLKWLINCFLSNAKSTVAEPKKEDRAAKDNQNQKYRKREISRFIVKGTIQQLEMEANQQEQQWYTEHPLVKLYKKKENLQMFKEKLLSIGSSNAQMILEDTIDALAKKSDYIEKFVALRESYDNSLKENLPMTSQAILNQAETFAKKQLSNDKFKTFIEKILQIQKAKNVITCDFGIQVTPPAVLIVEKPKKDKNAIKINKIMEQLENQKSKNHNLQFQIEVYEKKLSLSLKQYQSLQLIAKKYEKMYKYYQQIKANRKQSEKMLSNMNHSSKQLEQTLENDSNLSLTQEQLVNLGQIDAESFLNQQDAGSIKKTEAQLMYQTSVKKYTHSQKKSYEQSRNGQRQFLLQDRPIALSEEEIQSDNLAAKYGPSETNLRLQSQLHGIQISNNKEFQSQQTQTQTTAFKIFSQVRIFSLKIGNPRISKSRKVILTQTNKIQPNGAQDKQEEQTKRQCPINQMSPDIFLKNRLDRASEQQMISFEHRRNKSYNAKFRGRPYSNYKLNDRNMNLESFYCDYRIVGAERKILQSAGYPLQFKVKQMVMTEITKSNILQFYLDEQTVRNYELLNISYQCGPQKKKAFFGRVIKSGTESSLAGFKNTRPSPDIGQDEQAIGRSIYAQVAGFRKKNKQYYMKLLLLFRYPLSLMNNPSELTKTVKEGDEKELNVTEIQSYVRRIWNIHSRCEPSAGTRLCCHQRFILQFFGYEQVKLEEPEEES